jgi:Domain of unknown function (DUF4173)
MRWIALAAAFCAAAVIPAGPPGIGVVLVAVLIAAAARPRDARAAVFTALALALASFAAARDAGWVVAADLTAAWLTASVAAAGACVRGLVAPVAALDDLPSVVPSRAGRLAPALRGAALGGFLVMPFGALFLAADAAFAELGSRIPFPSGQSLPLRAVIFAAVLVGALGLGLAARRHRTPVEPRPPARLSPIEWAVPLAALVTLFAAFVAVQLAVLFAGHDHVLETAGLTYAEYAREGFWELLAAAGLTLTVIAAAAGLASAPRRRDRILLRALLGTLCALTLIVIASALHRLHLYEDAYGLTRLRLAGEAVALWLGGAFLLVALAGLVRAVRARLADLAVAGTALALLAFSLVDPDALIAKRNIEDWQETGRLDVSYLSGLSADAVPALTRLPEPQRTEALLRLSAELDGSELWTSANLGRARARDALRALPRSARRTQPRPR